MRKIQLVVFLFIFPLAGQASFSQQPTKIGEFSPGNPGPSLSATDASDPSNIILLDLNFSDFNRNAGKTAHQFNRVYVTDGNSVRQFNRNDLGAGQLRQFDSTNEILDLEPGITLGQIVVLSRNAVSVVDFNATPAPVEIGSFPLPSPQSAWGNLMERFGDYIYVADCSIPGFRILDIGDPSAIADRGSYSTAVTGGGKKSSSCPTDIKLRNGLVSLVIRNSLELVQVSDFLYPVPVSLFTLRVPGIVELELQSNFAFLADGSRVRIVDVRTDSPTFGQEIVNFDTGQPITALRQRGNRLYVVCGEQGYQVWDVSDYS